MEVPAGMQVRHLAEVAAAVQEAKTAADEDKAKTVTATKAELEHRYDTYWLHARYLLAACTLLIGCMHITYWLHAQRR